MAGSIISWFRKITSGRNQAHVTWTHSISTSVGFRAPPTKKRFKWLDHNIKNSKESWLHLTESCKRIPLNYLKTNKSGWMHRMVELKRLIIHQNQAHFFDVMKNELACRIHHSAIIKSFLVYKILCRGNNKAKSDYS